VILTYGNRQKNRQADRPIISQNIEKVKQFRMILTYGNREKNRQVDRLII
jgi:hypothetical protein